MPKAPSTQDRGSLGQGTPDTDPRDPPGCGPPWPCGLGLNSGRRGPIEGRRSRVGGRGSKVEGPKYTMDRSQGRIVLAQVFPARSSRGDDECPRRLTESHKPHPAPHQIVGPSPAAAKTGAPEGQQKQTTSTNPGCSPPVFRAESSRGEDDAGPRRPRPSHLLLPHPLSAPPLLFPSPIGAEAGRAAGWPSRLTNRPSSPSGPCRPSCPCPCCCPPSPSSSSSSSPEPRRHS